MEKFTPDKQFNLNEHNVKMAFSFETKFTKKLINDPQYVRWMFKVWTYRNNTKYEKIIPHHECTDEDYAKFYPIRPDEKSKL